MFKGRKNITYVAFVAVAGLFPVSSLLELVLASPEFVLQLTVSQSLGERRRKTIEDNLVRIQDIPVILTCW